MQRITSMAMVAGLIAVLIGLLPAARSTAAPGNNTTAFNATEPLATTAVELLPLGVLALAAGAILMSTGILGRFR